MKRRFTKKDLGLLESLADYRVLTAKQVAVLYGLSIAAVSRRLLFLQQDGFVQGATIPLQRGRGRPEKLFSLTDQGVDRLRSIHATLSNVDRNRIKTFGSQSLRHQLLVNWFRVCLVRTEREALELSVRYMSPTSPFLSESPEGQMAIYSNGLGNNSSQEAPNFVPDGVFLVANGHSSRAGLFFLEVDMGTEPLWSKRTSRRTIEKKLLAYHEHLASGAYRRYEAVWNCQLNGVCLLFLTPDAVRSNALSGIIQASPIADRVWVTEQDGLVSRGPEAEIWAPGSNGMGSRRSIFSRFVCTPRSESSQGS